MSETAHDGDGGAGLVERLLEAYKDLIHASVLCGFRDGGGGVDLRTAHERLEELWAEIDRERPDDLLVAGLRRHFAQAQSEVGDRLFYEKNDSEAAFAEFGAALRLDPDCLNALRGMVAVCLQGSTLRLREALVHAVRLAELEREEKHLRTIAYIRSLMAEAKARERDEPADPG